MNEVELVLGALGVDSMRGREGICAMDVGGSIWVRWEDFEKAPLEVGRESLKKLEIEMRKVFREKRRRLDTLASIISESRPRVRVMNGGGDACTEE